MGKIKSLIIACATLLLCFGIITASTYAIFTDGAVVAHHLVAGTLDVTLERTKLERVVLDKTTGELVTVTDDEDMSFTNSPEANIFGIEGDEVVVPGTSYTAYLSLGNNGNVAFNYTVKVVVHGDENGESNALAEQLIFSATEGGETVASKTLSEIKEEGLVLYTGEMNNLSSEREFAVSVSFVNDTTNGTNDKAQNQEVYFDLIIEAVQKTASVE
ncbi:MAG: hypothetical protein J6Q85_07565 [Clostridia bacterium]|nr:hypothetical protein [Clostridia bacterium]